MVGHSWHRDWLEEILSREPRAVATDLIPSPDLTLSLMSIVKIARRVILGKYIYKKG